MAKLQRDYALGSLTLVLNAAEGSLQLALSEGLRPLCLQMWDAPVRGTEILAPALRQIFAGMKITAAHVGRIACVRGPGSFTGIRLVLATAAALRRTTSAQVAGLDYMQALAMGAGRLSPVPTPGQSVWVLTHARRGLVHAQPFCWNGVGVAPLELAPVALLSPQEAVERIRMQANPALPPLVLGSALERDLEGLSAGWPQMLLATRDMRPACLRDPDLYDLVALAHTATYADCDIEPLYIRPCDAVENLPHMAERLGIPAETAAAELDRLLQATPSSIL